jgi:hypothetical protein
MPEGGAWLVQAEAVMVAARAMVGNRTVRVSPATDTKVKRSCCSAVGDFGF